MLQPLPGIGRWSKSPIWVAVHMQPKPMINIIVNMHVILDAGLPHGAHERVDIRNAGAPDLAQQRYHRLRA